MSWSYRSLPWAKFMKRPLWRISVVLEAPAAFASRTFGGCATQWPRRGGQCWEVETKKNKRNPSSSWGPCCCWPGFCVSGLFGDWVVRWIHRWNICLNSGRSYTWDPHVVIFPTMKAEECRNLTNLVLLPSKKSNQSNISLVKTFQKRP